MFKSMFLLVFFILLNGDVFSRDIFCKKLLNKSINWNDLDAQVTFNGYRPIAKLVDTPTNQISKKSRQEMERLKRAGGTGRYVQVVYYGKEKEVWSREEVIEVLSPPKNNPIYGSIFGDMFKRLNDKNVPIVIDPHAGWISGASVYTSRPYSDNASAILFLGKARSNLALRHELKHVLDFSLESKKFLKLLPKVPSSIHEILLKIKKKKSLTWLETRRIKSARELPRDLGEVRASEGSVKSLFSARGFKEIFLTKGIALELYIYFSEIFISAIRNYRLLYHSAWVNPTNPANIIITLKLVGFGYISYELIGKDIVSIYQFYTRDFKDRN